MITAAALDRVVRAALEEDAPWGDITSTALLPAEAVATADLVARESGTFSGGDVFAAAFALTDPGVEVDLHVGDGDRFESGDVLASVRGNARSVLTAERVALNFVQRMAGIATLTAAYVEAVAGTGVRIADTRKTTPGLREFERHAVVSGGGSNHRRSLSDAVMAKDNHLAVLRQSGRDVAAALREGIQRLPHTTHVVVEVDRLEQIPEVLDGGADTVLLDNFTLDDLRAAVALIGDRATAEASGGVTLDTVRAIAETGVQVISVGALTHSARALDLGLDVRLDVGLTERDG
ncbi:carboxylating nicotinate-nucleotide diphosphorylase [Microbacterium neungamense]|uniref:carboxylating nicotinate-nucleotide diphosphorylase n=1 Tax=Microbacterium neungamense TaxID=2810535 RepID=UPI00217DDDB7|nr:carboxylating nicotinate-nucleotide diphosphorylase [Microbacterium neungamense]UWF78100.1 carboxylating nicotinate-nucleotide diphosphorylase [Microbacterium neungamense]